jgi:hypothetical protein
MDFIRKHPWVTIMFMIKYTKQTHGEATLTSLLFNEDGLHPYIGKDSTESVTCKPKTTRLLTKN